MSADGALCAAAAAGASRTHSMSESLSVTMAVDGRRGVNFEWGSGVPHFRGSWQHALAPLSGGLPRACTPLDSTQASSTALGTLRHCTLGSSPPHCAATRCHSPMINGRRRANAVSRPTPAAGPSRAGRAGEGPLTPGEDLERAMLEIKAQYAARYPPVQPSHGVSRRIGGGPASIDAADPLRRHAATGRPRASASSYRCSSA